MPEQLRKDAKVEIGNVKEKNKNEIKNGQERLIDEMK